MIRAAMVFVSMAAVQVCVAAEPQQRFITCPVYRDTNSGRKSGCWLATDPASGKRYDISQAPTKPDWNHEVLVEGVEAAAGEVDVCGATVLAPVRVSVLPGSCTRHMLPAEGYPGRTFVLPLRNVRPISSPREPARHPLQRQTFYLFYDFNSTFGVYQLDDYFLDRAATYIRQTAAHRVVVTGFEATLASEVSGRKMAEQAGTARLRAESVAESLRRLGVPPSSLVVKWRSNAEPVAVADADGLVESSRRRVEIDVAP